MAFNIYGTEGMTINNYDIHDNQVVNIGSIGNDACPTDEMHTDESDIELPPELATPEAMKYWKGLQEAGFVSVNYGKTNKLSRRTAAYIADLFAIKLDLKSKWAPFEQLWDLKNLRQEMSKIPECGLENADEIEKIFKK